jgi:putative membrane protein
MHRWAIWVGIFLVSTVLPAVAQDAEPGWWHGSYGMMGDGSWVWMMIFGPLMMILFVAAVVILVAFALRWLTGHGTHASAPPGRTPLDILKERYARGEIEGRVRGALARPRRVRTLRRWRARVVENKP